MPAQLTKEEFVKRAHGKHGDRYDYTNTVLRPNPQCIEITCPTHGVFEQSAGQHIAGKGCRKCSAFINGLRHRKPKDKQLQELNKIHGGKYDYSLLPENYVTTQPVSIICPIHGIFQQAVDVHRTGRGCALCGTKTRTDNRVKNGSFSGWATGRFEAAATKKQFAILYLIKCFNEHEQFFKVGVTSKRRLHDRFSGKTHMPYRYEVILEVRGADGAAFSQIEKRLKQNHFAFKYSPWLLFPGYSECFSLQSGIDKAFATEVAALV